MSLFEICVVVAFVAGALLYLVRLAWRHFSGHGDDCCSRCPVISSKITLAPSASKGISKRRP